ncbi:MAG: PEP-CTERM sorting domain-containing protein [Pirellulales bacterium]
MASLASAISTAEAAKIGKIGFSLRLSADKGVILAPDGDWAAAMASTTKSYQESLLQGKMPYLELTNFAETASITNLSITVGDTTKNFDMVFPQVTAAPGIGYTVNSLDRAHDGVRSDVLDMGFTGFGPGKSFLFRVDIDDDNPAGNPYLDFRSVLFNVDSYAPPAGGGAVGGGGAIRAPGTLPVGNYYSFGTPASSPTAATNALVSVKFSDGYSVNGSLPNFQIYDPPLSPCSVGRSRNQIIEAYTYTKIVPEPSSLAILAVGTVGLLLVGWRRKAMR